MINSADSIGNIMSPRNKTLNDGGFRYSPKIYNKGTEEQIGRRSYDKNFKVEVALEALREVSTLQELGRKYNIHPSQLAQWKKQLHDGATDLFERPNKRSAKNRESEEREEALLKKVGLMSLQWIF